VRLRGERDLLSTTRAAAPARQGALLVLAGAVLWGTAGASQELLDGSVPPLVVGALRTILGGIALAAVALRHRPDRAGRLTVRAAWGPLVVAGFAIALYQAAFFVGVDALGIAVGTIVGVGSAPFFAGALALATGQGRPTAAWLATTTLAVGGLALLVRPDGSSAVPVPGVLAALSAGLAFGTFTVVSKGLLARGMRRLEVVAVPFVLGGLLLLPVLVVGLRTTVDVAALSSGRGPFVIAWLALGATAAAYLLFSAGLGEVSAVVGATLALAEPLTATLLGVLVFAERLGPVATSGALLVATALALTVRRPDRSVAR